MFPKVSAGQDSLLGPLSLWGTRGRRYRPCGQDTGAPGGDTATQVPKGFPSWPRAAVVTADTTESQARGAGSPQAAPQVRLQIGCKHPASARGVASTLGFVFIAATLETELNSSRQKNKDSSELHCNSPREIYEYYFPVKSGIFLFTCNLCVA